MSNSAHLVGDQREPLETSLHFAPVIEGFMSRYQVEVFGPLLDQHCRTIGALRGKSQQIIHGNARGDWLPLQKIAQQLESCCRTPYVAFNEKTADITIQEMRCKSRLCPRCGRSRSYKYIKRLQPILDQMDSPRFVTFTIKQTNDPLPERIKHVVESFAKVRRSKQWKDHFGKGFYTIEIKVSENTDLWHPHIHAIVDGQYLSQKLLAKQWLRITKDSIAVDIRIITSKKKSLNYINNYINKGQDSGAIPFDRIPEWAIAIKNTRMISTFGGARMGPDPDDEKKQNPDVETIAPIHHLGKAAADGDTIARDLWDHILHQARKDPIDHSTQAGIVRARINQELIDRFRNWQDPPAAIAGIPPPKQTAQASMWDRNSALGSD